MLELLFNNQNTERILFYLQVNKKCYARSLSKVFNSSVYGFQTTLQKLEKAGIIVSFTEGKIRIYQFNPRYPLLKELQEFVARGYLFLPKKMKDDYYDPLLRKRPRRAGKPLPNKE